MTNLTVQPEVGVESRSATHSTDVSVTRRVIDAGAVTCKEACEVHCTEECANYSSALTYSTTITLRATDLVGFEQRIAKCVTDDGLVVASSRTNTRGLFPEKSRHLRRSLRSDMTDALCSSGAKCIKYTCVTNFHPPPPPPSAPPDFLIQVNGSI